MEVTFWGTRGSIATPGPTTVRYGGNTACVSVRPREGPLLVLDAGTGIRLLGQQIEAWRGSPAEQTEIVLLLSHGHWDHIQGFPFFAPAYDRRYRIQILGASSGTKHLHQMLSDQMERTYFPVPWEGLQAETTFTELSNTPLTFGSLRATGFPIRHPGGGLGYRIQEGDTALVYLTDNELPAPDTPEWAGFVRFCAGANFLIHDAHFTDAELERHQGWGHSSQSEAVRLALEAGVQTLALFHHAPERTDTEIDEAVSRFRAAYKLNIVAAAEGDTYQL